MRVAHLWGGPANALVRVMRREFSPPGVQLCFLWSRHCNGVTLEYPQLLAKMGGINLIVWDGSRTGQDGPRLKLQPPARKIVQHTAKFSFIVL